jgi:hypothetical protein
MAEKARFPAKKNWRASHPKNKKNIAAINNWHDLLRLYRLSSSRALLCQLATCNKNENYTSTLLGANDACSPVSDCSIGYASSRVLDSCFFRIRDG